MQLFLKSFFIEVVFYREDTGYIGRIPPFSLIEKSLIFTITKISRKNLFFQINFCKFFKEKI